MKNKFIILFALITLSCNSGSNDICNCYKIFVKTIESSKINLNDSNSSKELQKLFDDLRLENETFQKCNLEHFSQGKFNLFCMLDAECLDCEYLQKISENGPLMYYNPME